jgi:nucleoside 2-deoxyribosyltransferase
LDKKSFVNGRCCVFQPFDKGDFDKRFDDVLVPAIEAAGMEPYRVDRDLGSTIPVDTLHQEIRSAAICIADITTRNPNVMYELGYAVALGKRCNHYQRTLR